VTDLYADRPRGKDRTSLCDDPIHLTGFTSSLSIIWLYLF
jgi:hypothetical protein